MINADDLIRWIENDMDWPAGLEQFDGTAAGVFAAMDEILKHIKQMVEQS